MGEEVHNALMQSELTTKGTTMLLDEMLDQVRQGALTVDEAARAVDGLNLRYAIAHTEPVPGTEDVFYAIRSAWKALQPAPAPIRSFRILTVRADCGHDVPGFDLMSTSTGSSCPDCYDRMS